MAYKVYCGLQRPPLHHGPARSLRDGFRQQADSRHEGDVVRGRPVLHADPQSNSIGDSARPLRSLETAFAIDSSGFGSSRLREAGTTTSTASRGRAASGSRRTSPPASKRTSLRPSAFSTRTPTIARSSSRWSSETRKHFEIGEVMRGQGLRHPWRTLRRSPSAAGRRSSPSSPTRTGAVGGTFEKAFHFFQFNQEEYMAHYHKRWNVETHFLRDQAEVRGRRGEQERTCRWSTKCFARSSATTCPA